MEILGLCSSWSKAEREARLADKLRFYARASLLIVDEIEYLPVSNDGAICSSNSSTRDSDLALAAPGCGDVFGVHWLPFTETVQKSCSFLKNFTFDHDAPSFICSKARIGLGP